MGAKLNGRREERYITVRLSYEQRLALDDRKKALTKLTGKQQSLSGVVRVAINRYLKEIKES